MKGHLAAAAGLAAAALLGGCGGPNIDLQQLLAPPPAETGGASGTETGSLSVPEAQETSTLVSGTPTGVFADVARGALGCWFAADGPLKATHVYRAEAEPPAKGGSAEIFVHERDETVRDLRGRRVYRISFVAESSSVRVTMTPLKFEAKVAQAMAKDVESWAKGGESCQLRVVLPPPAPSVAPKTASAAKAGKGKAQASVKKQ